MERALAAKDKTMNTLLFNYQHTLNGVPVEGMPIHLPGAIGNDTALCGHDLAGDESLGYDATRQTSLKATCEDCIKIAEFAKKISKHNYKH